ncbi:hypothetical protein H0H92_008331 [Tricholoma furcatifolium]|nr:hypothetical protein H0H92_008331 [Tricholoma furcatifolium]
MDAPIIETHSPHFHPAALHEPQIISSRPHPAHYPIHPMPRDSQPQFASEPLYGPAGGPMSQAIPLHGPVSHPDGPRDYPYPHVQHLNHFSPHPPLEPSPGPGPSGSRPPTDERNTPNPDFVYVEPFNRGPDSQPPSPGHEPGVSPGGAGANHYPSSTGVPRLPPILQVEKQQVTTSATQLASASRRRNEAHFVTFVHIQKKDHMYANGLAAKRALRVNTTAMRSDGGAECRASNVKYTAEENTQNRP